MVEGGIDDFLGEFQWRRKNQNDLWNGFLHSLRVVVYNQTTEGWNAIRGLAFHLARHPLNPTYVEDNVML